MSYNNNLKWYCSACQEEFPDWLSLTEHICSEENE